MSMDGKIRWVVLMGLSSRNLVSSQGDIVMVTIEANTFDVAYSTRADTILPFHTHDQSHSRNVSKCQDEIGME